MGGREGERERRSDQVGIISLCIMGTDYTNIILSLLVGSHWDGGNCIDCGG